jgi:ketosteroid isomerase-like protein
MSQENVKVIRSIYDRWNDGDLALDLFDPKVEVHQQPRVFDTAGVFHGHTGLVASAQELFSSFRSIEWQPTQWADGDEWVVVHVAVAGVGIRSGVTTDTTVAHAWRLRDGRVTEFRVYDTEAEALEAVGPSG